MAKCPQAVRVWRDQSFKGRHFTAEVILWAVRWYLMFPISYCDLELMLLDRGVEVDHTTIFRWIQAYTAELEKRSRPFLFAPLVRCRRDRQHGTHSRSPYPSLSGSMAGNRCTTRTSR
jgi:hypothetical protein